MEPSPQGVQAMIESLNFGADAETAIRVYMKHAWRPIETAPTDGTPLLGYDANSFAAGVTGERRAVWPQYYIARWSEHKLWWEDEAFDGIPLTHWMPLPEPPIKGE